MNVDQELARLEAKHKAFLESLSDYDRGVWESYRERIEYRKRVYRKFVNGSEEPPNLPPIAKAILLDLDVEFFLGNRGIV